MKYGLDTMSEETIFEKRTGKEESIPASDSESEEAAAAMAKPRTSEMDAVIFSIQFYGKTIGEVGMMDQDLSELDWKKFKSYLFQNLLSVNHQENICVSYSDEEGDKLPIESDEEYQEALKVAKKKAEVHDKLVLDLTRQGGFPAMLSLVSSGIRKVSSSPPKEGGISFFKPSSPPKDATAFKAVGMERKLFSGFFMPDKGPIPGHVQGMWGYDCDEALECGKINHTSATTTTTTTNTTPVPTARTDCKKGPPFRPLRNSPPNLLFNFDTPNHNLSSAIETSTCQGVFGAGMERATGARTKDFRIHSGLSEQPPEWFTTYMAKFRTEVCDEVSQQVVTKVMEELRDSNSLNKSHKEEIHGRKFARHIGQERVNIEERPQRKCTGLRKKSLEGLKPVDVHKEEIKEKENKNTDASSSIPSFEVKTVPQKDDKNVGKKRKTLVKEEERLMKKQEKIERKKLILTSKYADEMDKASRTQEKVFAKMEGLRKKQFCSQEELSKLRKMVDKQQRFITAEQRQQRRNERKAGYQKSGKLKKINIDNKGFPDDASLLHAALQELEALAEDSTSDCAGGATTRGYDALYLKDITYPDGSVVYPGQEFVKTWKVVNKGVMPWNEKTTLCKWSQVRFRGSPAGWKLKPSMKRIVCPPLEPGQEGDISITFTAPSEPGWYATHWRFCQRGRVFGNQMWCAIRVEEEPSASGISNIQLENTLEDENGITKHAFTKDDMQDLSAAIMRQQKIKKMLHINCSSSLGQQQPPSMSSPPHEELPALQNDLGIVENYYDAEDPVQKECTEGLQSLTLNSQEDTEALVGQRKEKDLISFEEEAEVIGSGTSTPELLPCLSQAHAVVPLKEMAKESVEKIKDQELNFQQVKYPESSDNLQADSISVSSGSFSELDSEDQAILNESDSEMSDHEYYIVRLPECFNTIPLQEDLSKIGESNAQKHPEGWRGEVDRPDSPDFLTADEDDRTTLASDLSDEFTCPITEQDYASRTSSISQDSSTTSRDKADYQSEGESSNSLSKATSEEDIDGKVITQSLPDPPSDTKPFMAIPNEAIEASVLIRASSKSDKEKDPDTWASAAGARRSVVCEQPYSAQHKDSKQGSVNHCGIALAAKSESTTGSSPHPSQLPVDLVGALPDELVSIIPEDLVRGAWNTARSFITRINQEMLSPTSDSPGRVYTCEEETPTNEQQPPPPPPVQQSEPQYEEGTRDNTSAAAVVELPSPLIPPMQQLEDMGFHNREVNERLLTKYNGDVSCAVAELIILDCH